MKIIRTIPEMQNFSFNARRSGQTIAAVPTMGFLHDGHLSLIERAHAEADLVVVSIFVNPTQFAPNEDLAKYPRNFERDCALCEQHKVAAIFAPDSHAIYEPEHSTWVVEENLSLPLCGKSRPTHFRGVTTVVAKLFNAILPDIAIFGQKDAQQALIIRRMVLDLNFPIKIIVAPLVREPDGLALSSRNRFLSDDERQRALVISQTLLGLTAENIDPKTIKSQISSTGGTIDYVEILDADTLQAVNPNTTEILVAAAVFFGTTRLIDNILLPNNKTS